MHFNYKSMDPNSIKLTCLAYMIEGTGVFGFHSETYASQLLIELGAFLLVTTNSCNDVLKKPSSLYIFQGGSKALD